jgi:hypothetical protein
MCLLECPCRRPLVWRDRNLSLDFLTHVEICKYNERVDWIDNLDILLRRSSKANVKA